MSDKILTKKQQEMILARAANGEAWRDESDLERRRGIAKQFRQLIADSGVVDGKTIKIEQLCQLISLQWQIQNLNPMQMPQLLGLFAYKVHFANFQGTVDDLKALRKEETGSDEMHEGADLEIVSQCIRRIWDDSLDVRAKGASDFLEVPGAGEATVSGFLYLVHDAEYGLVNHPTKAPFIESGWLAVTKKQRQTARNTAKSSFANSSELTSSSLRTIFRWEVFLKEVKDTCGFADFHEVDQFLLRLSAESTPDALSHARAIVAGIREADVKTRKQAETKAKRLIEESLGKPTAEQLQALMKHLNTCLGKHGDVTFARFGSGMIGLNANLILENASEISVWIKRLWEASEEQVPHLLDEIWQQDLPGLGRLFPTAILYLRDNERFFVWTSNLDRALHRVSPGLPSKTRSGFGYREYCKGIQKLRKEVPFSPEMHDWVLSQLGKSPTKPTPPRPAAGEFTGFADDTFQFMEELAANNNQAWFDANKQRFRDSVDRPLRALVTDVGTQVITPLDPQLETAAKTGKCIARIRKNVWGKKTDNVFQNLYWAAFYRRDRTKQSDCQFFLSIRADWFQHGIYFGDEADDVRKGLADALTKHAKLGNRLLASLQAEEFLFARDDGDGAPEPIEIADYSAFQSLVAGQFNVYRRSSPTDSVQAGRQLVEKVGKDFQSLYPLFLMATAADPESQVPPFLEHVIDGGGDDDDVITIADVADRTFLEVEFFERLDQLLLDKQQLVFSGAPGTSKTYVALEYAKYLTQGPGEIRTVQFHPSYGYEDFIEGLRPVVRNGALTYEVENGVFKQLCNDARSNPEGQYVLVIDEINRGNLPRIFGELMFLLERREETTVLPYSKKPFSIPRNVLILGTMNTSDRSIALMDLALRRRFHFVSMHPSGDILLRWLKAHKKTVWVKAIFDRLNARLQTSRIEEDRLVGHAHFMSSMLDEDHLLLIWDGTVYPLLKEMFFTEPEKLEEFTLDKLRGSGTDDIALDYELDEDTEDEDEADDDEDSAVLGDSEDEQSLESLP